MSRVSPPSAAGELAAIGLAPDELLQIDVGAELRKLASARLQGPWQLPAELVRAAIRRGARGIEVELGRADVRVRHDGGPWPVHALAAARALADASTADALRHAALVELEHGEEHELIAVAGAIVAGTVDAALVATAAGHAVLGHSPRTLPAGASHDRARATGITLLAPRFDLGRARAWLHAAARFAPVPIHVDGRALPRGLDAAAARAGRRGPPRVRASAELGHASGPISAPALAGRVGFVDRPQGTGAKLWLTAHGVISAHLTLPGEPDYDAVLELGAVVSDPLDGAALREAAAARIDALARAALDTAAQALARGEALPLPDRAALQRAVLIGLRRGGSPALLRSPAVPWVPGERDAPEPGAAAVAEAAPPASAALPAAARWIGWGEAIERGRSRGALGVLEPGTPARGRTLPAAGALVLAASLQPLARDVLGIELVPCPPNPGRTTFAALLAGAWADLVMRLGRDAWTGAAIPPQQWTAGEAQLITALRDALDAATPTITIHAGARVWARAAPSPDGAVEVRLGRAAPEVRAAIAALTRDPTAAYVVALALCGAHVPLRRASRAAWCDTLARSLAPGRSG